MWMHSLHAKNICWVSKFRCAIFVLQNLVLDPNSEALLCVHMSALAG